MQDLDNRTEHEHAHTTEPTMPQQPDLGNGAEPAQSLSREAQDDVFVQIVGATKEALGGAADAYRETWEELQSRLPTFDEVVAQAVRLPGTGVNRASYLAEALGETWKTARFVGPAIDTTPARAGLSARQIEKIAKRALARDARRTTVLSIAAGIPGGAAAAATIPADLVQFYGYLIRAIQKLTYLYGWRDLVHIDGGEPDVASSSALVIFLGVMAGVERADGTLARLARLRSTGASDQALRSALAARAMQDEVNEISVALTKRMAHRLTGQVAGKAVPIVGMVISGTISFAGFGDMGNRLLKELKRHGA